MGVNGHDILVDVFTEDENLVDLFLREYPGKIREEQCTRDSTFSLDLPVDARRSLYSFYDLKLTTVRDFLLSTDPREYTSFEVRDSEERRFVLGREYDQLAFSE